MTATERPQHYSSHSTEPIEGELLIFLVTDLRGYTRFTQLHGDEAAARLAAGFADLVERTVAQRRGRVLELRGDEVLAIFSSPRQALLAATEIHARFTAEIEDLAPEPIKVGIGLDAGEAVPVRGGFRGGALNLAARLCSLAGRIDGATGEVFASETVVHLAGKINGLEYVDRGEVLLKGLTQPVRVMQVVVEGQRPEQMTPLQHAVAAHPANLPDEPTPFVGRERELDVVTNLLRRQGVRLLTLTGAGGIGKTRLALRAGAGLLNDFPDGIFFVSLASIRDQELVPSLIAATLKLREESGKPVLESLIAALRNQRMLLILDNFEHVVSAACLVGELLEACRGLHVLVTSRQPLHLVREHEYPVPPMSLPRQTDVIDVPLLARYDTVALFVQSAQSVKPDFEVTLDNAGAVVEICRRLDGLPLAIHLAAASVKLFHPRTLLTRLERRLELLTGGAGDLPARQRTLRSTIDWSYGLLDAAERTLFARLSVFVGGYSLAAAEAVCGEEGRQETGVLDGLAALLEKSLLEQRGCMDDDPRFAMLDTIREYAAERLESSGEAEALRARHANYFTDLAASAELLGAAHPMWLDRLDNEHDNLRAALEWSMAHGEAETALRLGAALWQFWHTRGYLSEGSRWLDLALKTAGSAPGAAHLRAAVLNGAGALSCDQGDYQRGQEFFAQSLALQRDLGDQRGICRALVNLGTVSLRRGDPDRARELFAESLPLSRALGHEPFIAIALTGLGNVAMHAQDYDQATSRYRESLEIWRRIDDRDSIAALLKRLAAVALEQGSDCQASTLFAESLTLFQQLGDKVGIASCLEGCARIAGRQDHPELAVLLWSAADTVRTDMRAPLSPFKLRLYRADMSTLRARLSHSAFDAAWGAGQSLPLDEAGERALRNLMPVSQV